MSHELLPKHIAIIMDGNGRWAQKQGKKRSAGHKAGVDAIRKVVRHCSDLGVQALTLFAFSSENWRRPKEEVSLLMDLYLWAVKHEVKKLHEKNVRLRVIGDLTQVNQKLQEAIQKAEALTQQNTGLNLVVALNYGGQWDICQSARKAAQRVLDGELSVSELTPEVIEDGLTTAGLPTPDLFIRTSGETRISNFLIWQLAYTELYFPTMYWPDFDEKALDDAISYYAGRERRFGMTSEQVHE